MAAQDHDPQQERVYDWEDSFTKWAGAHLTLRQAQQLMRKACRLYKVRAPKMRQYRSNNGSSQYQPMNHRIMMRPRHMNPAIVLHETAHAITDKILGWDGEAHGAEFVGIYMCLLAHFDIAPVAALHASADAAGVRYRSETWVGPRNIRRRYPRRVKLAKQTS